jgi:hypothetical protein
LQRHTREVPDTARARVDYRGLARSEDWKRLVTNLARTTPEKLQTREEKLAFWINAYNALAIQLVVANQPVDDVRDIGSLLRPVWKRKAGVVGGRPISLGWIEHEVLRPMGEPRVHTAIVCASVSCPTLRREPWRAAILDAQFGDALRIWLADREKGLRIDARARTLYLSRVFDWFADDFGGRGNLLAYLKPYMTAEDRAWLKENPRPRVRHLDYDWRLNGLARIIHESSGLGLKTRARAS